MRVMTWNLWWRFGPWREREPAIAAVVEHERPDLVLLQEVWGFEGDSAAHRLARRLGLDPEQHVALTDDAFAGRRGEMGVGFHNAIVSRWPLTDVESHPLPRRDGTPGHRRVLSAAIHPPDGRRWWAVSTHLDHRFDESDLRQAQCCRVLEIVAALRDDPDVAPPVVIGGDFNATPDSDEIRTLTGRRSGPVANLVLGDCWEQVGDGPGHTWRGDNPYLADSSWPNRRLDYVFVSWPRPKPLGNPVQARLAGTEPVGGVMASDHAAVVVDLHVTT